MEKQTLFRFLNEFEGIKKRLLWLVTDSCFKTACKFQHSGDFIRDSIVPNFHGPFDPLKYMKIKSFHFRWLKMKGNENAIFQPSTIKLVQASQVMKNSYHSL